MNNKRHIRLKEFFPGIHRVHTPSESYIKKSPLLQKNRSYFQKVDNNGFMQSHLNIQEDKKIFLVGDSFIESIFIDESKRINAIMEESFLFQEGKEVKVYNAGVSGSTGLNLFNLILNKIIILKPDVIIYSQPSCDFSALLYENGYYNNSKYFSNIITSVESDVFRFKTIQDNLIQIQNNIIMLSKLCELYSIDLFISTCCSNSSKRQLKMMNDIIRENSYLGYKVIDLDLIVPKTEAYFYDKQHLNEYGSNLVANIYLYNVRNFSDDMPKKTIQKHHIQKINGVFEITSNNLEKESNSILLKIKNNEKQNQDFEIKITYFNEGEIIKNDVKKILLLPLHSIECSYFIEELHQTKVLIEPISISKNIEIEIIKYTITLLC
ncbi:TPA: SGNH/GDSL hydrolase family protein [Haemophilus influenzae]